MDAHLIWGALTSPAPAPSTPILSIPAPSCRIGVLDRLGRIHDLLDNIKRDIESQDHVFYLNEREVIISYIDDLQNSIQTLDTITVQN